MCRIGECDIELSRFGEVLGGDHLAFEWQMAVGDVADDGFVGLPMKIAQAAEHAERFASGGLAAFVDEFGAVDLLVIEFVLDVVGTAREFSRGSDHACDVFLKLGLQAADGKVLTASLRDAALGDPLLEWCFFHRADGFQHVPAVSL